MITQTEDSVGLVQSTISWTAGQPTSFQLGILGSHSYELGGTPLSRFAAREYCNNLGWYLAELETAVEEQAVIAQILEIGKNPYLLLWYKNEM